MKPVKKNAEGRVNGENGPKITKITQMGLRGPPGSGRLGSIRLEGGLKPEASCDRRAQ